MTSSCKSPIHVCLTSRTTALKVRYAPWGPFLETPDNFLGPKTILGAQYSPIAIQLLLILKHIAKFVSIITIS